MDALSSVYRHYFGTHKVALCFIISYEHVLHQEALWKKWIEPNADIVNVYFHCKHAGKLKKSAFIRQHALPAKFCASTTYINVTPAYLATMSYARRHDRLNTWFCMLTDSCVPCITPAGFRRAFVEHMHKSVIRTRAPYWNIHMHERANLKKLPSQFRLTNDPWFIYTAAHVDLVETFLKTLSGVYNTINAGGFANESLFAIVLQAYGQNNNPKTHLNTVSTVADWSRMPKPTSPFTFAFVSEMQTRLELVAMRRMVKDSPDAMFLRKVDRTFPAEVLEQMWTEGPPLKAVPLPNYMYVLVALPPLVAMLATVALATYMFAGVTSAPAT